MAILAVETVKEDSAHYLIVARVFSDKSKAVVLDPYQKKLTLAKINTEDHGISIDHDGNNYQLLASIVIGAQD